MQVNIGEVKSIYTSTCTPLSFLTTGKAGHEGEWRRGEEFLHWQVPWVQARPTQKGEKGRGRDVECVRWGRTWWRRKDGEIITEETGRRGGGESTKEAIISKSEDDGTGWGRTWRKEEIISTGRRKRMKRKSTEDRTEWGGRQSREKGWKYGHKRRRKRNRVTLVEGRRERDDIGCKEKWNG